MKSIIEEVMETVAERGKVYGAPHIGLTATAQLWSAYLGHYVSAHQVAGCMMLVKIGRLKESPEHRDSLLDVAGYACCFEDCVNNGV